MPTTNNKNDSSEKKTSTSRVSEGNDKKIRELEAIIAQLSETIKTMQTANNSTSVLRVEEEKDINPNKKTKITSLTYGYFSLYAPNRGFLKFPNYGSTHTITYAQLIDYVNACRTATENGNFYIHNQDMVEDLGLSEIYETLLSDKIIDKILFSNASDFNDILSKTTEAQKNNVCAILCQKVYDKEITDMGKIDEISKIIGVDIIRKVNEMKDTSDFLSKD